MTRTLRGILLSQMLLTAAATHALTVTFDVHHEYCGNSNGYVFAQPSGGVPPYTYLWDDLTTEQYLNYVPAGNYSVTVTDFVGTQVTEQVTVLAYSSFPLTDLGGQRAYCYYFEPGFKHSVFSQIGLQEMNLSVPIAIPVVVDVLNTVPMGASPNSDILIIEPPAPAGGSCTISYTDAVGCPGQAVVHVGYVVDFPVMSLLNVESACASAANGSVQVALSEEGNLQIVDLELKRSNGQILDTRITGYIPGGTVELFSGLVPGDYRIVQRIRRVNDDPANPNQILRNSCGDSIMVTVPDLGPACGNVNGTVYMDYNTDCVMGGAGSETRVPGAILEFTPGPYYATANGSGAYSINLPSGAYDMQQIAADIAQHCPPPPAPVNVSGVQTINVGDTALVPLDAQVMIASGPARPGFELDYAIQQTNLTPASTGTTSAVFTFDPAVSYISATPAPSNVSGNVLTWNQSALGAFGARDIQVRLQVPPDPGLIGTSLNASVVLTTTNTDVVTANNSANTTVTVTGSFDPNEKVGATSSGYSSSLYYIDVDNWIEYTIRFQNTGTDTAFTVIVTDTLPSSLDPSSIQWGASSHNCMRSLMGQGIVKFIFPNVMLPDSTVNELASHGFASFRLKPIEPLLPGTVIENTANIFFDYNDPVITEPSVLTAEFSTGVPDIAHAALYLVPNPAVDQLSIISTAGDIDVVNILSSDGRTVITLSARSSRPVIDVSRLMPGAYILRSIGMNGSLLPPMRFIKQ